jgi:hypothetical protein
MGVNRFGPMVHAAGVRPVERSCPSLKALTTAVPDAAAIFSAIIRVSEDTRNHRVLWASFARDRLTCPKIRQSPAIGFQATMRRISAFVLACLRAVHQLHGSRKVTKLPLPLVWHV